MALDPNAFSPDVNTAAAGQPSRQQKMRALLGSRASLGTLFNGVDDNTSDLSKSSLNGGQTTGPLATPGIGTAPGTPSLTSTERVPQVPNFAASTPLLTGEQQAGAELGEAQRGEEGVIGGGPGRQGLSTADRNRALMSFFRPQQQQQAPSNTTTGPDDTAKAFGSAKSAVGAAGKLKSLFSGTTPPAGGESIGTSASDPIYNIDPFHPVVGSADASGLTAQDRLVGARAEMGDTGAEPKGFSMPDFSVKNIGTGFGLAGSLLNLAGGASGNPDVSRAGQAAGIAGNATSFAIDPSAASGLGLLGAGLGIAGQATGNEDVSKAGAAANIAGAGASTLGALAGVSSPYGVLALPFLGKAIHDFDQLGARYNLVRTAAGDRAAGALSGLGRLFGQVPEGDAASTFSALRTSLGDRGSVRSYFAPPPDVAKELGLPSGNNEWRNMTVPQFNAVMSWLSKDPERLSSIRGSGDVGYLNTQAAENVGRQAAEAAKAMLARQLGLPYTPTPEPKVETPTLSTFFDPSAGQIGGGGY